MYLIKIVSRYFENKTGKTNRRTFKENLISSFPLIVDPIDPLHMTSQRR